ncbi:MAG: DNA alkylation repair protein [Microgenomates group bacterium]
MIPKKSGPELRAWLQKYLGTDKPTNCTRSIDIKYQATQILHDSIHSATEFYNYIDHLYTTGTTFEDLALAASIFSRGHKYRQDFDLSYLDKWLNYTVGWAEVDSLCQSNFHAIELLNNWDDWQKLLTKLSNSPNINQRRASLVLLCKSLGESDDLRIYNLALSLVEKMKHEKEVLITKAISWVLRQMVKHYSPKLKVYLDKNKATLPKIAYRETLKKITTGKKS